MRLPAAWTGPKRPKHEYAGAAGPPPSPDEDPVPSARRPASAPLWPRMLPRPSRAPSRRPGWIYAVAGLIVAAVLAWLVVLSPIVRIKHIRVDGITGALEQQIRANAGVVRGKPLLLTRLGPVETAVKKDRRVADAHIVRQFPDTLVVRVTPRVPVIALANSQGQVDLIDIEAVRYQTVSTAPSGVPVVRSAEGAAVTDTALRVALDVVQAMPEGLRQRMADLRVSKADAVSFSISGVSVVWGDAQRSELKAKLVSILLQENPKTIDVSAPDTPITT